MVLCLENLIRLNKVKTSMCLGNTWEVQMDRTNKAPCSHLDTEIRWSEWRRSYCSHTWYLFHRRLRDPWGQSDREKSLTSPLTFSLLTDMYWVLTAFARKVMFLLEQLLSSLLLLQLSATVFKSLLFFEISCYYSSVNARSRLFEIKHFIFCKYLPKFLGNILRPSLWLSQKCGLPRLP